MDNTYDWNLKENLYFLLSTALQLSEQLIPDNESLIQLTSDMDEQIRPPDWWKSVEFHFHYEAEGEELESETEVSQCSGPPSPLTAKVNVYTGQYVDHTDNRDGWCVLRWAVVAPLQAAQWFLDEVICFVCHISFFTTTNLLLLLLIAAN